MGVAVAGVLVAGAAVEGVLGAVVDGASVVAEVDGVLDAGAPELRTRADDAPRAAVVEAACAATSAKTTRPIIDPPASTAVTFRARSLLLARVSAGLRVGDDIFTSERCGGTSTSFGRAALSNRNGCLELPQIRPRRSSAEGQEAPDETDGVALEADGEL